MTMVAIGLVTCTQANLRLNIQIIWPWLVAVSSPGDFGALLHAAYRPAVAWMVRSFYLVFYPPKFYINIFPEIGGMLRIYSVYFFGGPRVLVKPYISHQLQSALVASGRKTVATRGRHHLDSCHTIRTVKYYTPPINYCKYSTYQHMALYIGYTDIK